jgi:hypothetical protein
MSFSTLKGEAVSLNSVPVPGPELSDSPRILVMYGVSVLWIFKTEECPTWFVRLIFHVSQIMSNLNPALELLLEILAIFTTSSRNPLPRPSSQ